jgi:phage tail-like protein
MKRTEIEHLLPGVFHRTLYAGSLLETLLEVMEVLHAPAEDVLRELDSFFDPRRAPYRFVPYLAGWVDLDKLLSAGPVSEFSPASFPTGLGRLRELVATAAFLSKWRGTAKGLLTFLETATGTQGFEIDEHVPGDDGQPRPFHLRVFAPQETEPYIVLITKIIELEKPAYVTYELEFRAPGP